MKNNQIKPVYFQNLLEDRALYTFPLWRDKWAGRVITFPPIFDPTYHLNCYKCDIWEYFDNKNSNIVITHYHFTELYILIIMFTRSWERINLKCKDYDGLKIDLFFISSLKPVCLKISNVFSDRDEFSSLSLPVETRSRRLRLRR